MLANATVKTTIAVTDLERAKAFYGKTLGLKETESPIGGDDDAQFETRVGSQVYLYKRPEPSGSTATACSFEVTDVRAAVDALQEKGVAFEEYDIPEMGIKTENGVAEFDGLQAAWFKDPDGNILAIGNSPLTQDRKTSETQKVAAE